MDDNFYRAFVAAWKASRSAEEVGRRLGGVLTAGEVRQVARYLAGNGVRIPPQPNGAAARAGLVLTPHPAEATRYVDGRGRLATLIGPEGPVPLDPNVPPEEGPWRCIACRRRYSGGWCLAGPDDRRQFACGRCVTVVG